MLNITIQRPENPPKAVSVNRIDPTVFDGHKIGVLWLGGDIKHNQIANLKEFLRICRLAMSKNEPTAEYPLTVARNSADVLLIQALLFTVGDIDLLLSKLPS